MIPTKYESLLARETELRALAVQSAALLPQLEMSEADATEFLATATPQQRATMSKLNEMLKAMSSEQRLEALKELAAAAVAARNSKAGKQ